ncbi:MAG: putative membrane protein [Myxococcota bacterium]|jgi:uncharacterized membrane protein
MSKFFNLIFRIANKIFFIAIVAIIVAFAFNNRQNVVISLSPLPFEVETRLFLLILFCFFGGVLAGFLSCSVSLTKEKFRNMIGGWKIGFLKRKVEKQELKAKKQKLKTKNKESEKIQSQ